MALTDSGHPEPSEYMEVCGSRLGSSFLHYLISPNESMHVPKSLWTKPVGGNLETSREWSAKLHRWSGTKQRGSASGWTSMQSEHTWKAHTKPRIVPELCLPASCAFCSRSLLSQQCQSILGCPGQPSLLLYLQQHNRNRSFNALHSLSFLPMFLLITSLLQDEIPVLKLLFLTLLERGITPAAPAQGTVQCQTAHRRGATGRPDWAKQGLEMFSQRVCSYSATKCNTYAHSSHSGNQVTAETMAARWDGSQPFKSLRNFITSPILSFTVTLFPIIIP